MINAIGREVKMRKIKLHSMDPYDWIRVQPASQCAQIQPQEKNVQYSSRIQCIRRKMRALDIFFCRTGRSYLSHSCLTFNRASDFCAHCNILIFNIDKYVYIVLLACNVRIVVVIIFIEINFLWDFFIKIHTHTHTHTHRRTIVFWMHVMMPIVDIHYIFHGSSTCVCLSFFLSLFV